MPLWKPRSTSSRKKTPSWPARPRPPSRNCGSWPLAPRRPCQPGVALPFRRRISLWLWLRPRHLHRLNRGLPLKPIRRCPVARKRQPPRLTARVPNPSARPSSALPRQRPWKTASPAWPRPPQRPNPPSSRISGARTGPLNWVPSSSLMPSIRHRARTRKRPTPVCCPAVARTCPVALASARPNWSSRAPWTTCSEPRPALYSSRKAIRPRSRPKSCMPKHWAYPVAPRSKPVSTGRMSVT